MGQTAIMMGGGRQVYVCRRIVYMQCGEKKKKTINFLLEMKGEWNENAAWVAARIRYDKLQRERERERGLCA
jgi:hypothetical protein